MNDSEKRSFPLGSTVRLADLAVDPYPILARLRALEPVSWMPETAMWLVTRHDDVLAVLRDWQSFTTESEKSPIRATFGAQMLSSDGPERRRFKAEAKPPFTMGTANARWARPLRELSRRLMMGFSQAGEVDLAAEFASRLSVQTMCLILGLPPEDERLLRGWYLAFAEALSDFTGVEERGESGRLAALEFRDYLSRQLESPRAARDQTLMSRYAANPQSSVDEVCSNVMIVLFGGIETTESMMLNALWALFEHPEQLARAQRQPRHLRAAIEESLRWEPAVQSCTRWASRSTVLRGVPIEAGDTVQCMIGGANRDPDRFVDPDVFDPLRGNVDQHLAFGAGRHLCLGSAVARLETAIALTTLFEGLPNLERDSERVAPPYGYEFRKPPSLHVRWSATGTQGRGTKKP